MNLLRNEHGLGILAIVGLIGAAGLLAAAPKAPNPPPGLKEQVVELRMEVRDIQARFSEQVKTSVAAPKRKTPPRKGESLKETLERADKELRKLEHPSQRK